MRAEFTTFGLDDCPHSWGPRLLKRVRGPRVERTVAECERCGARWWSVRGPDHLLARRPARTFLPPADEAFVIGSQRQQVSL